MVGGATDQRLNGGGREKVGRWRREGDGEAWKRR